MAFGDWSRGPWRAYVEDVLMSSDAPHWEYLVLALWNEYITNRRDRSRQMFALLMLALWWREAVIA